jgi:aconitate hydratase
LVEAYAKAQGLWHEKNSLEPQFTDVVELDLSKVEPSLAGPKRPQDRVELSELKQTFDKFINDANRGNEKTNAYKTKDGFDLHHGDVVIAAITSCTNTSNPSVLMAAGLVAKKALEKGLQRKPWVKTSLAPGSQVVTQYLEVSGLQKHLNILGFDLVGYGCTTCIGNSGPLPDNISETISEYDLIVSAVLSGNRNFEGRIHPQVKANWLASPPLVVVFALTGTTSIDLNSEPIGKDKDGQPVYLKDIWPSNLEVAEEVGKVTSKMFSEQYADVFTGNQEWQSLKVPTGNTYTWQPDSTYIQHPPFFSDMSIEPNKIRDIDGARLLALLGDSITTDHISPAGSIKPDSPAGKFLQSKGVAIKDFNSYGARRGNHEVLMRGTFANIRIRNEMVPGVVGGFTKHYPSNEVMSIYDAAMRYQEEHVPLIIVAGKEYGTGSSRDWAAKGPKLQGVSAVIAESFERIHRSNLIGMGILPLQFNEGENRKTLGLDGSEIISIKGLTDNMKPGSEIKAIIQKADGSKKEVMLLSRIDTQNEIEYYRNGGILQYVLRNMLKK